MRLKEFAPQWAESLEKKELTNPSLNIHIATHCIVGEAYGFENEYMILKDGSRMMCVRCWEFGEEFYHIIRHDGNKLVFNDERVNELVNEFQTHWTKNWNNKHRKGVIFE